MARRVVLLVSADRQDPWQSIVRAAGYLPLPALSLERAAFLVRKIRPSVILLDAQLGGQEAVEALHDLRGVPAIEQVPLVVLGALAQEQHDEVMRNPYVLVRAADGDDAIIAVLEEVAGDPRPTPRR